ncbi:hypothetical protein SBA1_470014 [Candidatus Sulfotelmatobacter kueseliae]|uniref:Uncharacterized protein n=1 Tax=Candidatus Sulfotelmatobacter kueseliae TaxID=2042962 RepID=A0A2U3KT22_9BACT|nr:hypothetical protein SBA1_470014 [Candidatus Sulfotelmatobacter kueseliae]
MGRLRGGEFPGTGAASTFGTYAARLGEWKSKVKFTGYEGQKSCGKAIPRTADRGPQTSDLRPQTSDLGLQTQDLRPKTDCSSAAV